MPAALAAPAALYILADIFAIYAPEAAASLPNMVKETPAAYAFFYRATISPFTKSV
jgi:hypothetical protein